MSGVLFSPDGSQLAFVSRDEWHPEVYVMPAAGGMAKRLTFMGAEQCVVTGWSPDGGSVYAISSRRGDQAAKVYRVNTVTGKMELWRTFGEGLSSGAVSPLGSYRSGEGGAYVYLYVQTLSQVYVVRGMK